MEKLEVLLSDNFVAFSQNVKALHEEKQKIKTEIKKLYEEAQLKLKELDKQVLSLQADFEKWKKDASLNATDS